MFLQKGLVKLVDNGDRKEDTSSCTNRSHEISNDREGTNAHATKGSGSGDVTVKDVNEGRVSVSLHDHLVVPKLLGDIASGSARHFNPRLGKEGTGCQDEDEIKDGMEGVVDNLVERGRGRNVVSNSANRNHLTGTSLGILPLSKKTDKDVGRSAVVEKLRNKVKIGDKSRLKDNGHVGCVKELDGVVSLLSTVLLILDGKIDAPPLKVNDNDKDKDSGEKVGQVGKILTVEGLFESANLVVAGDEQVEKSNNGSLEFSATARVDGCGTKCLPDNVFTNVGSDKE